jgi:hypothetical protein
MEAGIELNSCAGRAAIDSIQLRAWALARCCTCRDGASHESSLDRRRYSCCNPDTQQQQQRVECAESQCRGALGSTPCMSHSVCVCECVCACMHVCMHVCVRVWQCKRNEVIKARGLPYWCSSFCATPARSVLFVQDGHTCTAPHGTARSRYRTACHAPPNTQQNMYESACSTTDHHHHPPHHPHFACCSLCGRSSPTSARARQALDSTGCETLMSCQLCGMLLIGAWQVEREC